MPSHVFPATAITFGRAKFPGALVVFNESASCLNAVFPGARRGALELVKQPRKCTAAVRGRRCWVSRHILIEFTTSDDAAHFAEQVFDGKCAVQDDEEQRAHDAAAEAEEGRAELVEDQAAPGTPTAAPPTEGPRGEGAAPPPFALQSPIDLGGDVSPATPTELPVPAPESAAGDSEGAAEIHSVLPQDCSEDFISAPCTPPTRSRAALRMMALIDRDLTPPLDSGLTPPRKRRRVPRRSG